MSDFVEQLALAEKAAEDIYFARTNRELIESLHEQLRAEERSHEAADQSGVEAPAGDV